MEISYMILKQQKVQRAGIAHMDYSNQECCKTYTYICTRQTQTLTNLFCVLAKFTCFDFLLISYFQVKFL